MQLNAIGVPLNQRRGGRHPILLAMKCILILMLAACLQVSARGYSQTISVKLRDVPFEKALKEIAQKSGYRFFYLQSQVKEAKPVRIERVNTDVKQVLDAVFKEQPLKYEISNQTIVVSPKEEKKQSPTFTQDLNPQLNPVPFVPITVKGVVKDETGKPVIGANVTVKGVNKGTTTNAEGAFVLSGVDAQAILIISAVNIETREVPVNGKTDITVVAKIKTSQLEEVSVNVNTGYQTIPKERVTGSFEYVNNEELNRRLGTDILSRLEGNANSVLFDRRQLPSNQNTINASNVIIRGISTLTETIKAPLIVVNNFPYDGDINNINPNDVESITILKDAAAASIWGARAGNGVIVITTKQGNFNQRLSISVNSNTSFIEKPRLFFYRKMSSSDFIDVESFLFGKGYYDGDINNIVNRPALSPVVEILERRRSGGISSQDSANQIDALRIRDVRNDFDKYIYQTGIAQQYSINLNGGSPLIKYSFSLGYDKSRSTQIGNEFNRFTLRSNTIFALSQKIQFQTGIAFSNSTNYRNSLGNIGDAFYNVRGSVKLYPYAQFADGNGNPLAIAKDYRVGYVDTAGAGKLLDWKFKPLDELRNRNNSERLQDVVLNIGFNYKLTNYLSFQADYQYQKSFGDEQNYNSLNTYFSRNLINLYSVIQGNSVTNNLPKGGILNQDFKSIQSQNGRGQVNFNKKFNGTHQLDAIVGGEIRERKSGSDFQRIYGYNDENLTIARIDYVSAYPLYGGRGSSQITQFNSRRRFVDRWVSIYANASYTYGKRYTLSASARRDGANLFGQNTNDKWKPIWTIGTAWNINNEKFFRVKDISLLRMRATYGYQGNVNNALSPYTIIQSISATSSVFNLPSANITIAANPDLTWETIRQLNFGFDAVAFKNRLSLSFEFYRKKSDNLILRSIVDPTTGLSSLNKNSAGIEGGGIDISVTSVNIIKPFKWITGLSLNTIATKVSKYNLNDKARTIQGLVSGGQSIVPIKDRSPYAVYSYPFAGLDPLTGDPQGYLGKTVSKDYLAISRQTIDTADLVYHGSSIPTLFGFLNNSFEYKGFTLLINATYAFGYYFRKSTINYQALYTLGQGHPDYNKRWQKPGDETFTTIPSIVYPLSNTNRDQFYANSTATVVKGDHIRISNIRASYLLKASPKQLFFSSFEFYINITNLGIIWRANKESLDPDYDTGNASFPVPKTYALGLRMNL